MAKRSTTPSRAVLAGVLLLVACVLALAGPGVAARLRSTVHWALAPLGDAGMYLTTAVKSRAVDRPDLTAGQAAELVAENRRLRGMVTTQREWLRRIHGQLQGGRQAFDRVFSRAYGPDADVPVRLVPARVVAGDSMPYGWSRLVQAGDRDGVEADMLATQRLLLTDRQKQLPDNLAALSGAALVGRVVETGAFTARLQLVTDEAFASRAHIGRVIDPQHPRQVQMRARMVPLTARINYPVEAYVRGDGRGQLVCEPLAASHNVQPGDILQTRGDEAMLPAAVVIGRVTDVSNDPEHPGMVLVRVEPLADLSALREVYLVVPRISRPGERKGS
ncbi:MAG: hypothetical protein GVY16_07235 [Planctomycetes bacterium]|jgi:cell shape-determining protein MreC|nr:hypothetical protein [Planctomycetota bacterium]